MKLIILASGSGSNAENIVDHFKNNSKIEISAIVTNNKNAGVIDRADRLGIPFEVISKSELNNFDSMDNLMNRYDSKMIILAGFLLLMPNQLIAKYPTINIHPALLPNYGGKGMYGMNVHKAVVDNREKESGITIHEVNENYDEGKIIFQAKCEVTEQDTPEDVAAKIHKLEYLHFPSVIEDYIKKREL